MWIFTDALRRCEAHHRHQKGRRRLLARGQEGGLSVVRGRGRDVTRASAIARVFRPRLSHRAGPRSRPAGRTSPLGSRRRRRSWRSTLGCTRRGRPVRRPSRSRRPGTPRSRGSPTRSSRAPTRGSSSRSTSSAWRPTGFRTSPTPWRGAEIAIVSDASAYEERGKWIARWVVADTDGKANAAEVLLQVRLRVAEPRRRYAVQSPLTGTAQRRSPSGSVCRPV